MAQTKQIDDFKGNKVIELNPGDTAVGVQFEFTVKASASAAEGYLGYGRSISSVVATIYNDDTDADVTTSMLDSAATESNNIVTVPINHPGTAGVYRIKLIATLDDTGTRDVRFRRVIAR